jgi:hypothetical protein
MTTDHDIDQVRLALETLEGCWHPPAYAKEALAALWRIEERAAAWKPISSAPRDGTYILIAVPPYDNEEFVQPALWYQGERDESPAWENSGGRYPKATHWMPLPPPPKPTETQG